jgi:hypothetical protein
MTMLLMLAACTGPGNLSTRNHAPFDLGKLQSALWFESTWADPDDGDGSAYILLTDGQTSCSRFQDELNGDMQGADSLIWKDSGVLLQVEWFNTAGENIGYEGAYSAMQPLYGYGYYYYYYDYDYGKAEGELGQDVRWFDWVVFSEGVNYASSDYGAGVLNIDSGGSDEVTGRVRAEWFTADFTARNCGRLEQRERDSAWWDTDAQPDTGPLGDSL